MLAIKEPGILDAEFFRDRPADSRDPSEEPRSGSGKAAWVTEYEVVAIPRGIYQRPAGTPLRVVDISHPNSFLKSRPRPQTTSPRRIFGSRSA